jgi:antagonist of KipI
LLACAASETGSRFVAADWATPLEDAPIRLLEGGQTCWYDTGPLFATTYTVTSASNRMGLRLSGEPLRPRPGAACVEIASEPVCPGTVQVTRDGQCIILGVDGQTIGGYPKVGHVIRADWDRFGQLRPGEPLRFRRVELEEAESADRTAALELRRLLVRLAAQIPDSAS